MKHLFRLICYNISVPIEFLDANNDFQPVLIARFANSNVLIWPLWVVVTCPLAGCLQSKHCRRYLHYIGQVMGHELAFSLSHQDPGTWQTIWPATLLAR